jgi:hypothetical protein
MTGTEILLIFIFHSIFQFDWKQLLEERMYFSGNGEMISQFLTMGKLYTAWACVGLHMLNAIERWEYIPYYCPIPFFGYNLQGRIGGFNLIFLIEHWQHYGGTWPSSKHSGHAWSAFLQYSSNDGQMSIAITYKLTFDCHGSIVGHA